MINVGNILVDNEKTRDELLDNITIEKCSFDDTRQICELLTKAFDLSSYMEAFEQLDNSICIMDESIKAVDKRNGDIYGSLIFCDYDIRIGTPIMLENPTLGKFLGKFNHVNGHSFVLDKRLRGCGVDKLMLNKAKDFLFNNFDYIYCGIDKSLKSQAYWKKLGFVDLFEVEDANFMIMPLNENLIK